MTSCCTTGQLGEAYNVGGGNESPTWTSPTWCSTCSVSRARLITLRADRPGHDRRYSLDTSKMRELGWSPKHRFEDGLRETVDWYLDNREWWEKIKSGEFAEYYAKMYEQREVLARHS